MKLQNVVTNNVFLDKKVKTTKQKIKHKNPCWSRENKPGTNCTKADASSVLPSQLKVSIVVE